MKENLSQEMLKFAQVLEEMYDQGVITKKEMILAAMQEGLNIGRAILNEKEYKCTLTF